MFLALKFWLFLFLFCCCHSKQHHTTVPIWPDPTEIPGLQKHDRTVGHGILDDKGDVSNVHVPTITHFLAPAPNIMKPGVIVCPGGGYSRLAFEKEGVAVAKWLNKIGITAFILRYRHRPYQHPNPLLDGLQAIRYVRANANKFAIHPNRLGIMGFSAGGHLAASAGTLYNNPDGVLPGGETGNINARPDFMALIYPVITMDLNLTHLTSRKNLVGENPKQSTIKELSLNLQVSSQTPPAFIVHTGEDEKVSVENSILMYKAMQRNKVPAELHLYAAGPHGLGMTKNNSYPVTLEWPNQFQKWLAHINFFEA